MPPVLPDDTTRLLGVLLRSALQGFRPSQETAATLDNLLECANADFPWTLHNHIARTCVELQPVDVLFGLKPGALGQKSGATDPYATVALMLVKHGACPETAPHEFRVLSVCEDVPPGAESPTLVTFADLCRLRPTVRAAIAAVGTRFAAQWVAALDVAAPVADLDGARALLERELPDVDPEALDPDTGRAALAAANRDLLRCLMGPVEFRDVRALQAVRRGVLQLLGSMAPTGRDELARAHDLPLLAEATDPAAVVKQARMTNVLRCLGYEPLARLCGPPTGRNFAAGPELTDAAQVAALEALQRTLPQLTMDGTGTAAPTAQTLSNFNGVFLLVVLRAGRFTDERLGDWERNMMGRTFSPDSEPTGWGADAGFFFAVVYAKGLRRAGSSMKELDWKVNGFLPRLPLESQLNMKLPARLTLPATEETLERDGFGTGATIVGMVLLAREGTLGNSNVCREPSGTPQVHWAHTHGHFAAAGVIPLSGPTPSVRVEECCMRVESATAPPVEGSGLLVGCRAADVRFGLLWLELLKAMAEWAAAEVDGGSALADVIAAPPSEWHLHGRQVTFEAATETALAMSKTCLFEITRLGCDPLLPAVVSLSVRFPRLAFLAGLVACSAESKKPVPLIREIAPDAPARLTYHEVLCRAVNAVPWPAGEELMMVMDLRFGAGHEAGPETERWLVEELRERPERAETWRVAAAVFQRKPGFPSPGGDGQCTALAAAAEAFVLSRDPRSAYRLLSLMRLNSAPVVSSYSGVSVRVSELEPALADLPQVPGYKDLRELPTDKVNDVLDKLKTQLAAKAQSAAAAKTVKAAQAAAAALLAEEELKKRKKTSKKEKTAPVAPPAKSKKEQKAAAAKKAAEQEAKKAAEAEARKAQKAKAKADKKAIREAELALAEQQEVPADPQPQIPKATSPKHFDAAMHPKPEPAVPLTIPASVAPGVAMPVQAAPVPNAPTNIFGAFGEGPSGFGLPVNKPHGPGAGAFVPPVGGAPPQYGHPVAHVPALPFHHLGRPPTGHPAHLGHPYAVHTTHVAQRTVHPGHFVQPQAVAHPHAAQAPRPKLGDSDPSATTADIFFGGD